MLERYTRAQLKGRGKGAAFDLEDDEPGELTHMGKSLSFDNPVLQDDFADDDMELSDAEERAARKRRRSDLGEDEEGDEEEEEEEDQPERKKSKQEVMKEVIAKSKLHKYERQTAKDDDEDLREELDKEMSSIHALLQGLGRKPPPAAATASGFAGMNSDRLAALNGADKARIEKEYDIRLRQLAQDQRSKPTEKSKTEEQIIEDRARKLQDLEAKKQRRMQGEQESSDEEVEDKNGEAPEEELEDEEEDFGLGGGNKTRPTMAELGVEDEDDFVIDDDLVASGSEIEDSEAESSDEDAEPEEDDEDDEFIKDLLSTEDAGRPEFLTGANAPVREVEDLAKNGVNGDLAYTFECPQSHEELLQVLKKVVIADLPTAIIRIRTIYDPKLKSENKGKLGKFAAALVDHISYLANQEERPPFAILETVIRHIHSMAKNYGVEIANAFRRHLEDIRKSRSLSLNPGDLVLFTAVGTIFSTSDHFHQVVTPTNLTMARYLGLKIPQTLADYATGTYLATLCVDYQRLSKRYVPEVMNFLENSLCVLSPKAFPKPPGSFPYHEPKSSLRIRSIPRSPRQIRFYDCVDSDLSGEEQLEVQVAILEANLEVLGAAAETWSETAAFIEMFEPVLNIVKHLSGKGCKSKLPESTLVSFSLLTLLTLNID